MIRAALNLLLLATLLAPSSTAARFQRAAEPEGPLVVEHGFGGAPAFRLEMPRIAGQLERLGGPQARLLDLADYSNAGTLVVYRTLALGPLPQGAALVPPGEYAVSLRVAGVEGLPEFGLLSLDGLRLRIPMVSAPRPKTRPTGLSLEALASGAEPSVSLPLAIHLPTVSGLVVLGPLDTLVESPLRRRLSRTEVIQQEMQRRALESGHVRPAERRKSRDEH